MYLLNIFNTLADLIILWLLASSSKTEDYTHPLAALVTISAAPYVARLYPTIVWAATFSVSFNVTRSEHATDALKVITVRDQTYESIMLSTVVLTFLYGGALTIERILKSAMNNEELTSAHTRKRLVIPLCFSLLFSMAFYNNLFDEPHQDGYRWNNPLFVVIIVGIIGLALSQIWASMKIKEIEPIYEHREAMKRCLCSFQIFFILCTVPIFYMIYQIRHRRHNSRFMFSDFDCFIRLIFVAALLTLEPFANRLRLRERLYRIDADNGGENRGRRRNDEISNRPNNFSTHLVRSQSGSIETVKPPTTDETTTTIVPLNNQLPSYDAARKMMSQPWSTVSEDEVNIKNSIVPVNLP